MPRTYKAVKPSVCDVCGKTYKRRDSFMYHQRICKFQQTGEVTEPVKTYIIDRVRRTNMKYMSGAFDGAIENYQNDLSNENQDDILSTLKNTIVNSYDNVTDELEKKKSIKLQVSLFAIFHQACNEDFKTEPPIVINSDMMTIMSTCLLEDQLMYIYNQLVVKIEEFQERGSSWILNKLVKLDFNFYEYRPF